MGCDFYIYVYLEIEHTNGISYYEFPTMRGYYCELDSGIYDSDDEEMDHYNKTEEYKEIYDKMQKMSLTPRKPVVLYKDGCFTKEHFRTKYLPFIELILSKKYKNKDSRYENTGLFDHFEQIIKITKKEDRYDPYSGEDECL